MKTFTYLFQRFFLIIFLWTIVYGSNAQAVLKGTASFLNSGSRPATGVDISAFGASTVSTTESGMFVLKFPDKKPGDKVKIIVGSKDRDGTALELVNDKVLAQIRIPSKPDDDIVEIIVCKVGQRNEAALRYNGIIVRTINEATDKRLQEIDKKLGAVKIDAETIVSLQNEKEKLAAERDSALAKAEEQALFIASINLDKASKLVREAVIKVDSLQDIPGAIGVLDNEMLYQAYLEASEKKKKAEAEMKEVVEGFQLKIQLLEPFYRYGEIAECYEKIAEIYKNEGYNMEELAKKYADAAYYWGSYGEYQKELKLDLEALSIREKLFLSGHSDLGLSYHNLASTYGHLGEFQKQLEYNLKALAMWENVLPAEHPLLATSYSNLAFTYGNLGQYQKEEEYNLKAINIREKIFPKDHPDLAMSYRNLGSTYNHLGDYQKAMDFNLRALNIQEKIFPADHPILQESRMNLSKTYDNLGEYQKAIDLDLMIIPVMERTLPNGHPNLSTIYTNLANAYGNSREYQKALEYNLKALIISETTLPASHPDLAVVYSNVALSYDNTGNHQKALEYNLKAVALKEIILPGDHPSLATSYNNLAFTYGHLEDHEKELEFDLKALAIREKNLPSDHPALAGSYNNIAYTYGVLQQNEKALEFYFKSLSIFEKVLPPAHPNLATIYFNIGRVYRDIGDYVQSIFYTKKSIQIAESAIPNPLNLNRYYTNLGIIYAKARQFPEAKSALEKSETMKQEERVYRGWAIYYALQKKKKLAIENLQKALSLGFKDLKWLETEPDLKNIRKEKGYKEIVGQLQKQ